MRKQLAVAAAAGTVIAGVLPLTAAAAATTTTRAHPAVLTVGKAGGKAVKRGAIIAAGLKKGTAVTFLKPGSSAGVTCKLAGFANKVLKNPPAPGIAIETTRQHFGKCSVHGISGARGVKSIKLLGLPYRTTVSGRAGNPIVLFKARTTLVFNTILGSLTCTYGLAKVKGNASNVGNVNTFKDQTFTKVAGAAACPSSGNFSATFGPVKDLSVKGHPKVFFNR